MHYVLFKSRNRAYLEEMNNRAHEMPEVYKAVNSMQNTPFKINTTFKYIIIVYLFAIICFDTKSLNQIHVLECVLLTSVTL